ncbi:MAG: hypothetical protein JXR94_23900 [Candidatus Hydrogenedentes bacterium]|nr:hypothetical protein [Candidatus Hydrogenedentota bacterium]
MKAAAATTGGMAITEAAGAAPADAAREEQGGDRAMKPINHLFLFIHPPVTYSYHRLLEPAPDVGANCLAIANAKSADETTAVCILQSNKGDKELVDGATASFGERGIVDPNDNSEATRALLASDADRAFSTRGNHGEWNIYEMWSSGNARRWSEGLKMRLAERGFELNPDALTVEAFGSWSGCHHKYSNFMTAYLGAKAPATVRAEVELCTHKGWPMEVAEFVECIPLDRHVLLFIVRRADGCPMAQYWDGLRPFYERPHKATAKLPPNSVDLFTFSPNSLVQVDGDSTKLKDGIVADVGDGCRPAFSTIVCRSNKDADVEAFRAALAAARIEPCEGPPNVMYAVEV